MRAGAGNAALQTEFLGAQAAHIGSVCCVRAAFYSGNRFDLCLEGWCGAGSTMTELLDLLFVKINRIPGALFSEYSLFLCDFMRVLRGVYVLSNATVFITIP